MKALITGASSGLGYVFAQQLSKLGYDLVLVARRKDRLKKLQKEIKTKSEIIQMDLSDEKNCIKLHNMLKEKMDIVINNAGFGAFGNFTETNLNTELQMIDVNIKCVHILTKLFLIDFKKKSKGYILNVASSAAFQPGPLMVTYYSTKSYVFNLTQGIRGELLKEKSNIYVGCLCPGPVETEFNNVAKVKFAVKSLDADYVVKHALKRMFKKKSIIIPGFSIKLIYYFGKLLPLKLKLKVAYCIQRKKQL